MSAAVLVRTYRLPCGCYEMWRAESPDLPPHHLTLDRVHARDCTGRQYWCEGEDIVTWLQDHAEPRKDGEGWTCAGQVIELDLEEWGDVEERRARDRRLNRTPLLHPASVPLCVVVDVAAVVEVGVPCVTVPTWARLNGIEWDRGESIRRVSYRLEDADPALRSDRPRTPVR